MSGADALVSVMQSEAPAGDRIEVHQLWGDLLVDVRQIAPDRPISIGSSPAWRWRLLGVDMGRIPALAARALPWVLPIWSDVSPVTKADFAVPSVDLPGGDDHELVRDGVVRVGKGWDGFVDRDGLRFGFGDLPESRPTPEGGWEVPLQPGSRVVVEVAGQVFHLRRAAVAKRAVSRFSVDPGLVGAAAMAAGLVGALVAGIPTTPVSTRVVEASADPAEYVVDVPAPKPEQPKQASGGAKAKGPEGRSGKHDARAHDARGKAEVRKQALDREIAESSGLLAASGPADHVLGQASLSAELRGGIGGLIGTHGTRIGAGGFGDRTGGLGGGGTADSLGIGLHGPGTSDGPDLGAKQPGEIATSEREVMAVGNIDKALINEVILRHLSQIRYCYQHQLSREPDLGGKVVVKFTISGDGTVSSASTKSSTLGDAAVEQCVVDRFMKMEFPTPKGGGMALVSYPFLFSPG